MLTSLRNPLLKRLPLIVTRPPPIPAAFSLISPLPSTITGISKHNPILDLKSTILRNATTCTTSSHSFSYLSVRLVCRKDVADMLSEALLSFGASSTSVDDPKEYADTDEICISSMFGEHQDVGKCILQAADSIGLKWMPSYEIVIDEQCDWVMKSQESFKPVEVAEGLWIVPQWISPPNLEATNIILNPGLAFGTGDHPTTMLCLLSLRALIKGGERFLDYGTGSGILAIAAVKLGAALSIGLDIDPQAISSARQNAALNNIGPNKMQVYLVASEVSSSTDGRTDAVEIRRCLTNTEEYDIVIANILLNPLLELADHIVAYAKPGAVVAVSGILSEQLPQIDERYSQCLEGIAVSHMDGWACLSGTKKVKQVYSEAMT